MHFSSPRPTECVSDSAAPAIQTIVFTGKSPRDTQATVRITVVGQEVFCENASRQDRAGDLIFNDIDDQEFVNEVLSAYAISCARGVAPCNEAGPKKKPVVIWTGEFPSCKDATGRITVDSGSVYFETAVARDRAGNLKFMEVGKPELERELLIQFAISKAYSVSSDDNTSGAKTPEPSILDDNIE